MARRYLDGLPHLRWHIPGASSVLRFNRAEGLSLGAGVSYTPRPGVGVELTGGYATGPDHLSLAAALRLTTAERTSLRADLYRNDLRDIGIWPGAAGVLNTIASSIAGDDYLDPFFASGGGVTLEQQLGGAWRAAAGLHYEKHRSARLIRAAAPLDASAAFRPVRPIDEGALAALRASLRHTRSGAALTDWQGELALEAGTLAGDGYGRALVEFEISRRTGDGSTAASLRAAAGVGLGDPPSQRLFLLGGRGTLPGYAYRSFLGDRFALVGIEISREVLPHWLRLRGLAALGWTDLSVAPPASWQVTPTARARATLGLGISSFYDVFRLDAVHGLSNGESRAIFSINPDIWNLL